jgi:phosphohistidine phosphatase
MKLYLAQHGDSLPEQVNPERPLSERGREDVRRLAEFLGGTGIQVRRVYHSGKLRARQTAELLGISPLQRQLKPRPA